MRIVYNVTEPATATTFLLSCISHLKLTIRKFRISQKKFLRSISSIGCSIPPQVEHIFQSVEPFILQKIKL